MYKYFIIPLLIVFGNVKAQTSKPYNALHPTFWDYFDSTYFPIVISDNHQFTEGPVWSKKGELYFSDIPANKIYKWTPTFGVKIFKEPSFNSNGLTFDRNQNLIICEQQLRQIKLLSENNIQKILVSSYQGKKFNSPNDIVFRRDGGFYFSDPPYGLHQFNKKTKSDLNFTGVYFVSKVGSVILIDSTLARANGVALSPDEKYLYVAQSEYNWIIKRYELDKKGNAKNSKILSSNILFSGNLDGIKTDLNGVIFATGNHGVVCIDTSGVLLGSIYLPENTSNLCWGDENLDALYITANKKVFKLKTKTKGYISY